MNNPSQFMSSQATDLLNFFQPIDLPAIASAGLQQRVETKFLVPEAHLHLLLAMLLPDYTCLEINGLRRIQYTTNYFDTAAFRLYPDHHNGYTKRLKIRSRHYEGTGDCFLEMKQKYNLRYTRKTRIPIASLRDQLMAKDYSHIHYPSIAGMELYRQLTNTFHRITLCNEMRTERVTIDQNICMANEERSIKFNGLLVVEVKQPQLFNSSKAIRALKHIGAIAAPFSKYAFGTALLQPTLKHNLFKPLLTLLKKHHYA